MRYALLYYYDPSTRGPTHGEVDDWLAFDSEVKDAGAHVHEAGFQSAAKARTVTVRDGQAATENGGVIGAGDILAGFYVLDVASAADAVDWAQRLPTAKYGKVEVRPIVEYP